MAWYKTGTVNLTNGSAAVVGVGTAFIANVDVGEGILLADGRLYEVQAVTSDTSLTLGTPYLGTNASGAGYVIAPISGYVRDLAHQAATLVQNYSQAYANRITGVAGYTGNVTIAQLLTALKTADGAGSGLDADMLDGLQASAFATAAQGTKADAALPAASYTASDVLAKIKTVDGAGSGLDADLLGGKQAGQIGTNYVPYANSSGNVLVNTTTDNGVDKLQVNGSILCAGGIKNSVTALSATGTILRKDSAYHTKIQFNIGSSTVNRLTLVIGGVDNTYASVLAQVNYFNLYGSGGNQTASRLYILNRLAATSNIATFTEVGSGQGSEMSLLSTDTSVAGQQTYVFSIPAGGYPSVIFDIDVNPYLSSGFSVSGSFSTV